MSLYLLLLLSSVSIPLVLSFDKKVRFCSIWPALFPSFILVGSLYLTVDVYFVKAGVWGFNPAYHSPIVFLGLPLEEWLFFIVIPYACIFIHYVIRSYFPDVLVSNRWVWILSGLLIGLLIAVIVLNTGKAYTVFNFGVLLVALVIALFNKQQLLNRFFISFPVMLLPFFIINSILTGTLIPGEVVWYNPSEILGLRVLTVPVEDIGYTFSLILLNLLLINLFNTFKNKSES